MVISLLSNLSLATHFDQTYDTVIRMVPCHRFIHIMGTVHTATVLAHLHGQDPTVAACAAFWHDCAKGGDPERIEEELRRRDYTISDEDRPFPKIWHALLSAVIAKVDYGLDDPEIFRAIYLHPTGDSEMTPLVKVVFLSDYTEPLRDFEGADSLRALAREDLDQAVGVAIRSKIRHIQDKGRIVHPRAFRTRKTYGAINPEKGDD